MINVNLQVRRANPGDKQRISDFMSQEVSIHRHLDWRTPIEWLGDPSYWLLENEKQLLAVLACPEDPPTVAWIRLFGHSPLLSAPEAWDAFWDRIQAEILFNQQNTIAAITTQYWFERLLLARGFHLRQTILLLDAKNYNLKPFSYNTKVYIRPMTEADMRSAAEVDLSAFGAFWHNTYDSLLHASRNSLIATVAEDSTGMIGYQLTTANPLGSHLARLAVRKEAQRRGVGAALIHDLIQRLDSSQSSRLSVNTQSDNFAALALYKKIGFSLTGDAYSVLAFPNARYD